MNLAKKKKLAARTIGVGTNRIILLESRLDDIKEAITKQDIRDLYKEGAIIIREIRGKKKKGKRKSRRGGGKIRMKIKKKKEAYIALTRKLRKYVSEMKKQGKISREDFLDIRKKIRNKFFKNKMHLKEYIGGLKK